MVGDTDGRNPPKTAEPYLSTIQCCLYRKLRHYRGDCLNEKKVEDPADDATHDATLTKGILYMVMVKFNPS